MDNMLEIRWHGRGGQGAKTASILLAKIAAAGGSYIQAFPEYGPERMGAPVLAYTRINNKPIHQHCQIEFPELVVVLDPTLVGTVDVTANLKSEGLLLINTEKAPEEIAKNMNFSQNLKIYTLDADKISEEEIGHIFPNTPMLGAFNKITKIMEKDKFINQAEIEFKKKFATKTEVVVGNVNAVKRAYQEVQGL
jgi:pyruvate ferredoxin oxidoreductase gamma subunit